MPVALHIQFTYYIFGRKFLKKFQNMIFVRRYAVLEERTSERVQSLAEIQKCKRNGLDAHHL